MDALKEFTLILYFKQVGGGSLVTMHYNLL